ncbi:MAG: matrixin family metalloprotease [Sandaracinaceae bacterium]
MAERATFLGDGVSPDGFQGAIRAKMIPMGRRFMLALLLCLVASPAAAFERTAVSGSDARLFWRFRTVTVRPLYDSSDDVPGVEVASALSRSIAAWNQASQGCSDMLLVDGGMGTGFATNLGGGEHDGENRIVWRESGWPEEAGTETLALTTLVFRRQSGQILDADIDLNGVNHGWSTAPTPPMGLTDTENTLTHELGHLIGLAHVIDPGATMFEASPPGDIDKRTLSQDEVDGVCTIYPLRGPTPGAPDIDGEGLMGSCRASPGGATTPLFTLVFAVLFGVRVRARRRRQTG